MRSWLLSKELVYTRELALGMFEVGRFQKEGIVRPVVPMLETQ